jgi:hypothetical protein
MLCTIGFVGGMEHGQTSLSTGILLTSIGLLISFLTAYKAGLFK